MARKARLGRESRGAKQIAVNCHSGLRSPQRADLNGVSVVLYEEE